jgi:N-acetyl-alpha-D-muramate 1-phosphate uridylyltransferase
MSARPDTAMVFAAGLGTRMRPISNTIPKPLVEVAGKPLIDHCLDLFAGAGVRRAIVNVHYLADQIEAHLKSRRRPEIIISDERARLLDQGGGIRKVLPLFAGKPFFLCNTDAFWIEGPVSNIRRLAECWDPARMDALLLVAPTASSVGVDWPGDFHLDAGGRLTRREERDVAPFVYSGVGVIKPELFAQETRDVFRLAPILFEAAEKGRLHGLRLDGVWLHVGVPAAIAEAEAAIARSAV